MLDETLDVEFCGGIEVNKMDPAAVPIMKETASRAMQKAVTRFIFDILISVNLRILCNRGELPRATTGIEDRNCSACESARM